MTVRDRADDASGGTPLGPEEEVHGSGLDRAVQARIGEQLRAMYDGLMDQPVPDRFHALLAQLGGSGGTEDEV